MAEELVNVQGLAKYFPTGASDIFGRQHEVVQAVDGIDLTIREGETLGLVGESGCGKSTVGQLLVRLLDPTRGRILFDGEDIATLQGRELRHRRKNFQIIFQDPYSSLNPRMRVDALIREPMDIAGLDRHTQNKKLHELLNVVGLATHHATRFPHEFSGGQRQRIGIARALALNPRFVVCDEAVSALDVSIQSQVVNLLKDLQSQFGLTYLFVAHDLSVVRHISDRVAVMYLGQIMEIGDKKTVFANPLHPYTRVLLSAIPRARVGAPRERVVVKGDVPSPINPPTGCRFHTRCPYARELCRTTQPPLIPIDEGRMSACHLVPSGMTQFDPDGVAQTLPLDQAQPLRA
ncbi:oligopeptide/dipeptide ABC transporter ATP-binding protein [Fodinicurvata sp. EGI_FJ10296]|uniref:ABC transporter ATP-binding protein n=1 Tax=Fodinicurvata sp. EGI_FJ10296 TaxID=3231908 RepID=UPI003451B98C